MCVCENVCLCLLTIPLFRTAKTDDQCNAVVIDYCLKSTINNLFNSALTYIMSSCVAYTNTI